MGNARKFTMGFDIVLCIFFFFCFLLGGGEIIEYLDNRTSYGAKAKKRCLEGYFPASDTSLDYVCSNSGWKKIDETKSFQCFNQSTCPKRFQKMVNTSIKMKISK